MAKREVYRSTIFVVSHIDQTDSNNDEPCVNTAQESGKMCYHRFREEGYVDTTVPLLIVVFVNEIIVLKIS